MTDLKSIAIYVLLATTILLGVSSCATSTMLKATRFALETQNKAIKAQKDEAAERLKTLNASVLAQQKRLDAEHASQEKIDATNQAAIQKFRDQLRLARAEHDRWVHDSAAIARTGGGARPDQAAAGTGFGASSGAKADWVLPTATGQEADEDAEAYDADEINNAYAACRADAFRLRRLLKR